MGRSRASARRAGTAVLSPSSAITLAADGRSIIVGGSSLQLIAQNGGRIPLPVRGLRNAVALERRPNNSILIADAGARRLFVRSANGSTTTLAGNGDPAVYGDAGPSEVVGIGTPAALAGLPSGDVVLHTGTIGRGGIRKVYAPKAIIGAWVTPGGGGATRPPDPALRRSEVFVPLKGTTRFSQPGESGFRRAQAFKVIRNGARIDTTQGNAVVRSAANGSASQEYYAVISLGRMQVRQRAGSTETDLTLTDRLECGRAADAQAAARRRRRSRVRARGRFRSRGNRSNVAARGTEWQLDDTCTSSVIRVIEGRVLITDRVRNRNFFARAPRTVTIRDR